MRVVTTVVTKCDGQLSESSAEGLDSESLFAWNVVGEVVAGFGHDHLGVSTTVGGLVVLDGGNQDTESVVDGSLGFLEDVLGGTTEHQCARLI